MAKVSLDFSRDLTAIDHPPSITHICSHPFRYITKNQLSIDLTLPFFCSNTFYSVVNRMKKNPKLHHSSVDNPYFPLRSSLEAANATQVGLWADILIITPNLPISSCSAKMETIKHGCPRIKQPCSLDYSPSTQVFFVHSCDILILFFLQALLWSLGTLMDPFKWETGKWNS